MHEMTRKDLPSLPTLTEELFKCQNCRRSFCAARYSCDECQDHMCDGCVLTEPYALVVGQYRKLVSESLSVQAGSTAAPSAAPEDGEEEASEASATGSKRRKQGSGSSRASKRPRPEGTETELVRYATFLETLQPSNRTWTRVDKLMFDKGRAIFGADHCSVAEFIGNSKTCAQVEAYYKRVVGPDGEVSETEVASSQGKKQPKKSKKKFKP